MPIALLVAAGCSGSAAHLRTAPPLPADDDEGSEQRARPDVAAARELDHEGVRSYRDGRYADAIRYFRASYRLGGPSSELWNIARSREKLDDSERAALTIDEYLARPDLSSQDRADAEREAKALRARSSTLTITTNPAGAAATVDGKSLPGATPLSIEITPGVHSVALRREGHLPETRQVEAHFGRAVIVSLDLQRVSK